jgi:hypothetical protein
VWPGLRQAPSRGLALWLAAASLALIGGLLVSPRYRVHGAVIHGTDRLPEAAVYAASGLHGRSIFAIEPAEAIARLEALEDVKAARLGTALPARVTIEVLERPPVLLWAGPQRLLGVDELGRAIEPPALADGLVRVEDESGQLRQPGDRIDPQLIAAAQAFGGHFDRLRYRVEVGFVTQTAGGGEAWLGRDGHHAARQRALLTALEAELADHSSRVERVDLRFIRRPYYRLRGN